MKYAYLVGPPWNAKLALTTAPAVEPVTLAEAKEQTRQTLAEDDAFLTSLITVARQWIEQYLGRQLITATWTLYLDDFPGDGIIELPRAPLGAVTTLKYYDTDRVLQTFAAASYLTHAYAGPEAPMGTIELAEGYSWPTADSAQSAIEIAYTAGYGAAGSSVPLQIRQAIKILTAEMYERREQVIVGTISTPVALTVERLLWPLRVF